MPSIVVTPKYNPFTFDELYRPLAETTKMQMTLEDQYNAMEMEAAKWERLADSEVDRDSYKKYKDYANALRNSADELATNGLNPQSRQALYGLRTRFNEDIFPLQEAYNWRQKQAEIQQKAMMEDPSYIWERPAQDIPLSEIINNPSMTLNGVSGEKIRKSYGEAVKQLKTSWATNPIIQSLEDKYPSLMPEIGGFLQEIETTGITRNELDAFINDFASNYKEEDRKGINLAIRSLLNAIEPIRDLYNIDKFNGNETIEKAFEGAIKLGAYDSLGANKDSVFKGNDPNNGKTGSGSSIITVTGPYAKSKQLTHSLGTDEEVEKSEQTIKNLSEDAGKENVTANAEGTVKVSITPKEQGDVATDRSVTKNFLNDEVSESTTNLFKTAYNTEAKEKLGLKADLTEDNLNLDFEQARDKQEHIHDNILVPIHNDVKKLMDDGVLTLNDISRYLSGTYYFGYILGNPEKMKKSENMTDYPGWEFNSYDNSVYAVSHSGNATSGRITGVEKADGGKYKVSYRANSSSNQGYSLLTEEELISLMLYNDTDESGFNEYFTNSADYMATKLKGIRGNQVDDIVNHYFGILCQSDKTRPVIQDAVNNHLGSVDFTNRATINYTDNTFSSGAENNVTNVVTNYVASNGRPLKKFEGNIDRNTYAPKEGEDAEINDEWTPVGFGGSMYSPDIIINYVKKKGNIGDADNSQQVILPYDISSTQTVNAWINRVFAAAYNYIETDEGKLTRPHKKELERAISNIENFAKEHNYTPLYSSVDMLRGVMNKKYSKEELMKLPGKIKEIQANIDNNESIIFHTENNSNYTPAGEWEVKYQVSNQENEEK